MDNAIEEALLVPGGMIEIRITGKPYGCSYTIRNSVTRQTMQRGVHTGESTKGNGRGRGLAIVQELLEAYRNAALNSCLLEDTFIQSLTLSWTILCPEHTEIVLNPAGSFLFMTSLIPFGPDPPKICLLCYDRADERRQRL